MMEILQTQFGDAIFDFIDPTFFHSVAICEKHLNGSWGEGVRRDDERMNRVIKDISQDIFVYLICLLRRHYDTHDVIQRLLTDFRQEGKKK